MSQAGPSQAPEVMDIAQQLMESSPPSYQVDSPIFAATSSAIGSPNLDGQASPQLLISPMTASPQMSPYSPPSQSPSISSPQMPAGSPLISQPPSPSLSYQHRSRPVPVTVPQSSQQAMLVNNNDSNIITSTMNQSSQSKYDEYKRMKEHSVQISNIISSLTPRLVNCHSDKHFFICRSSNSFGKFVIIPSSNMKHESLCKQIINDMNTYGICVVDDFLGSTYGLDILREGK